ncbi:glycosyltransferase family 25 protein [Aureimonas mangrovi]|uniref:glycosyltransferase family 25 protein n=1 Tax=Aureimonas mangrovi TaxID=2758041 RepID=UPI00163DA323|nr:glycosyltransferase family 25 protein [Aureimonas mangrovi]
MLPIRFINLDRAAERRAFMERQGERHGLAMERVRAVDGGEIDPGELARLAASWQRPMSAGEVACFLSHKGQWERVVREDAPAVILEDDAVFSPRLPAVLAAASALSDIEVLNLEDYGKRRFLRRGSERPLADGVSAVRCLRDKAGSAAYVVWPQGAQRLLSMAGDRAGPADAMLHGAGLLAYVCEPAGAVQLSVLEDRGLSGEIDGRSHLQAPRGRQRTTTVQRLRRFGAQVALLPHHLGRLAGTDYRRIRFEPSDFSEVHKAS